jgi:glycosyltransferase involved in cell wall biosynthesis
VLVGEAKWAAYARAEVLCLPTFFEAEALPLVVIEAMSIGLPVVATRWRGIPSLIDDSRTGYLVEVRDPEALAERLARLAADPALRAQLGTAAREKFLREYVVQRHLERMEAVFQAVGATRPAACELVRPAVTVGATSESRIHGVLTGGER